MTESTQYKLTLPPTALTAIQAILGNSDQPEEQRFTAALVFIFGWSWWEQQEVVDPRATAIPGGQWRTICNWMNHMGANPVERVNWGLSFMNSGPSSFEE